MLQPTRDLSDTYHFGISWLPIARTRISYSQYFTHVKSDTSDVLDSFPNALSNGTPANLGISFDTKNGLPCAAPIYRERRRKSHVQSLYRLLQLRAVPHQHPHRAIEFSEQLLQAPGGRPGSPVTPERRSDVPFSEESFAGVISRTHGVETTETSSGATQNITTSADLGATYDITDKLRINDSFRWYDFRLPGAATLLSSALFSPSGIVPPKHVFCRRLSRALYRAGLPAT